MVTIISEVTDWILISVNCADDAQKVFRSKFKPNKNNDNWICRKCEEPVIVEGFKEGSGLALGIIGTTVRILVKEIFCPKCRSEWQGHRNGLERGFL